MGFEREADLCAAFIEAAAADGWTAYPEQGGWDILLVRRGVQIGVQAKLKANEHVLVQAVGNVGKDDGPHYRAVLVGGFPGRTNEAETERTNRFYTIAQHLRLIVFDDPQSRLYASRHPRGRWCLWSADRNLSRYQWYRGIQKPELRHYRRKTIKTVWLPPFVPKLEAGIPSPRSISPWKICACELEKIAITKGWVCLSDAREVIRKAGAECRGSTLLNRFYRNTGLAIEGGRQRQWVRADNYRASIMYPVAWAALNEADDGK